MGPLAPQGYQNGPRGPGDRFEIKNNVNNEIKLGSLDIQRDWSYAGDVMKAAKLIIESDTGEDYVIGSGKPTSIKTLVEFVFRYFDLDYLNYFQEDKNLLRPNEPKIKYSSPKKIKEDLLKFKVIRNGVKS